MRAGTTDADEGAVDMDTQEGEGDDEDEKEDEDEDEEEEDKEDEEKEEAVDWVRDLVDGGDALVLACRAAWYAN